MSRSFSFGLLTFGLLASGCHWEAVAYQPQPALVVNPASEIKALLKLRSYPASVIEITDESIKEFYASAEDAGMRVLPLVGTTFRIITRDDMYLVAAYDSDGMEIWGYRPASTDLPTSERMINALVALARRQPATQTVAR